LYPILKKDRIFSFATIEIEKGILFMGLLSSVGAVTRYRVQGKIESDLIETISEGLKKNKIVEIDGSPMDKASGWTSLESPFIPDFSGSSFILGTYFVFSMRVDRKNVPSKIVNKHYHMQVAKKLKDSEREFISRKEKKMIKEHVRSVLNHRIPATPNVYDLIWDYENASLWFFSTLKSANEELEELFKKSFKLTLIRLFPYTIADLTVGITEPERDRLADVSPTAFRE